MTTAIPLGHLGDFMWPPRSSGCENTNQRRSHERRREKRTVVDRLTL